jgi:hypothetical protein
MIDRLLMNILPGCLHWLFQRARDLLLNRGDTSQAETQTVQSFHRLDDITMTQRQSSSEITDHRLSTRPDATGGHFLRPLGSV